MSTEAVTKATAAVVEGTGAPFTVTDIVLDSPRSHEVVVRVKAVGMWWRPWARRSPRWHPGTRCS